MTISIPINTVAIMDKEVINELLNNNQNLIFQYMINNKIFSGYVTDLKLRMEKWYYLVYMVFFMMYHLKKPLYLNVIQN